MKSLFLRIFLSFWMAQALFVVLAILVTLVLRPRGSSWEALRTTALNEAVSAYEEGGPQRARDYLDGLQNTQHVRAYLFDELGEEVSRRGAPDWAMRVLTSGSPSPDGFIIPAPKVLKESRASSDGQHHFTLVMGLPPGPRVFLGPGDADPGPHHWSHHFRPGVLLPGMVFDQADCAAAGGDTATGSGRSNSA